MDNDYWLYDDDEEDLPQIHLWYVDDDGHVEEIGFPDLGPCCICEQSDFTVQNIMMLHKRAPEPGSGWGCFQCGLPPEGATAVICDACLERYQAGEVELRYVIAGSPTERRRVPIESLSDEPFDHDYSKHPEIDYESN